MEMFVEPGEEATFAKTVEARDLATFAEISGDYDPIHLDEDYARGSVFGRRIAHGALVMGVLSTTASMISRRAVERGSRGVSVSLGYDRIRFLRPVFVGDTITARYRVEAVDPQAGRSRADVTVENQAGELCLAGTHVMRWLPPAGTRDRPHIHRRPHPEALGEAEPRGTHDGGACFEADLRSAPQHEEGRVRVLRGVVSAQADDAPF